MWGRGPNALVAWKTNYNSQDGLEISVERKKGVNSGWRLGGARTAPTASRKGRDRNLGAWPRGQQEEVTC